MGTLLAGPQALFGPGEIAILLSLLFIAVPHCRPLWAVACGTLNGVALLLTPVRCSHSLKDDGTLGSTVGGLVLIGLVAGPAAYLCSLVYRRTVAVTVESTDTALASRIRLVAWAIAASGTAGLATAKSQLWCSPRPKTSRPAWSAAMA